MKSILHVGLKVELLSSFLTLKTEVAKKKKTLLSVYLVAVLDLSIRVALPPLQYDNMVMHIMHTF